MSQQDVIDLLRKEKREMTAKEMMQKIGIHSSAICSNITKLRRDGIITRRKLPRKGFVSQYTYKLVEEELVV